MSRGNFTKLENSLRLVSTLNLREQVSGRHLHLPRPAGNAFSQVIGSVISVPGEKVGIGNLPFRRCTNLSF